MNAARAAYTVGLAVSLGIVPGPALAHQPSLVRLDVLLQNDGVAPADVARLAQREVARLFALIDVDVNWIPAAADAGPAARVVKLTTWEPADRKIPAKALGITFVGTRGTRRSYVIWPRVQKTAFESVVGLDAMLAVAIAHELGHLLLPLRSHDARGLMRESWDEADLRLAAAGLLHFSRASAVKIALGLRSQAAIAARKR